MADDKGPQCAIITDNNINTNINRLPTPPISSNITVIVQRYYWHSVINSLLPTVYYTVATKDLPISLSLSLSARFSPYDAINVNVNSSALSYFLVNR